LSSGGENDAPVNAMGDVFDVVAAYLVLGPVVVASIVIAIVAWIARRRPEPR
jgi:uncharacterized membrane protein YqiK